MRVKILKEEITQETETEIKEEPTGEEHAQNDIQSITYLEPDTQYNTEISSYTPACTPVFTADNQIVCLENVQTLHRETDAALLTESGETAEESSASSVETSRSENTYTDNELLNLIYTQIGEYIESDDTFKSNVSDDLNDSNVYLSDIYGYLNVFLGIYLIGWIFSQTNSWRRNNKSY